MKKLIAHPEWDTWIILITLMTSLLAISIAFFMAHGNVFRPDGRPDPAIFVMLFGVFVTVTAILILSEAKNARKWLANISRTGTLRGYMNIKLSLGMLVFAIAMFSMMVSPGTQPISWFDKVVIPFMLFGIGFTLLRRSRLSPWAIPELELAPAGLALPRSYVTNSDSSGKRIKPPGNVCLIPWDCMEAIDWRSSGNRGTYLYVATSKTIWFKNWGAYSRGEPVTSLDQAVNLKVSLAGDTIPPDAVVLAAQRYIHYANKGV